MKNEAQAKFKLSSPKSDLILVDQKALESIKGNFYLRGYKTVYGLVVDFFVKLLLYKLLKI